MSTSLKVIRGDTIRLTLAITRPDNSGIQQPVDLTGATIYFTMKTNLNNSDHYATTVQKTNGNGISIIDSANGKALVTISPLDTIGVAALTDYYYDVELIEIDGTVTTVVSGVLTIVPDVSLV